MRRAQVEMMEMIIVLFIFFVMLAVGLYYYYSFSAKGIQSAAEETKAMSGPVLIASLPYLPDFQCSFGGSDENCVDVVKILSFDGKKGYASLFDRKKIYVKLAFPPPKGGVEDVLCDGAKFNSLDFPDNCGYFLIKDYDTKGKQVRIFSTPIPLYYPDRYIIGELVVEAVL
ncbi:hypothetical protein HY643_05395 [Candidatus Woesearchaeota archaeon]|nr:hypothetical protein [Candidatus Woesearchaeota archaeon]